MNAESSEAEAVTAPLEVAAGASFKFVTVKLNYVSIEAFVPATSVAETTTE